MVGILMPPSYPSTPPTTKARITQIQLLSLSSHLLMLQPFSPSVILAMPISHFHPLASIAIYSYLID